MPEWLAWTLIGVGVLALLALYLLLGGSGRGTASAIGRDRRTNESLIQSQSASVRNQSSGGFGI